MASVVTTLSRRLKSLLLNYSPNEFDKYLQELDVYVASISEDDPTFYIFEKDLHNVRDLVVNDVQYETFIAVLHRLTNVLPSTSLITSWWDLCLRPVLRNPRLSAEATQHAQELVLTALHDPSTQYTDLVAKFRQQLIALYLHDAFNEGSADDILAWAEKDQKERLALTTWKANLEAILVKHGCEHPTDLLDEINDHFISEPERRLQLAMLLNSYTSSPAFPSESAPLIAAHPLIVTLVTSLQLDHSSTVCAMGLTILVKLMPVFAVGAIEELKRLLPKMLGVLSRALCWRRQASPLNIDAISLEEGDLSPILPQNRHEIREDLLWKPLEVSFSTTGLPSSIVKHYFTLLYFLFPCNTIRFLRQPIQYLATYNVPTLYTTDWSEVLDEDQIKSRSEPILRRHVIHPHIIWGDADAELANSSVWAEYDVSRIVSECSLLDVGHAGLALQHRSTPKEGAAPSLGGPLHGREDTPGKVATPRAYLTELPPSPPRQSVSLQDILTTSVLIKSGQEIDLSSDDILRARPNLTRSPSSGFTAHPALYVPSTTVQSDELPTHIAQAISELQRELLLLRNELNLELWINRENIKHIGRLHDDRVLSRGAEAERQALHNRLREYKNTVARLQEKFSSRDKEATNMKTKIMEWNADIQKKYEMLRAQRGQWDKQTASLRSDNVDLKAKLEAQGTLLAERNEEVFALKTKIKETGHKIDRLGDYEAQIVRLTAVEKLRNEDAQKYQNQKEEHEILISNFKKMQLRLESYENTQAQMVEENRLARQQVRDLEARLLGISLDKPRPDFSAEVEMARKRQATLSEDNVRLRREVEALQRRTNELQISLERAGAPPGWALERKSAVLL